MSQPMPNVADSRSSLLEKLTAQQREKIDRAILNNEPAGYTAIFKLFQLAKDGVSFTAFYYYARRLRGRARLVNLCESMGRNVESVEEALPEMLVDHLHDRIMTEEAGALEITRLVRAIGEARKNQLVRIKLERAKAEAEHPSHHGLAYGETVPPDEAIKEDAEETPAPHGHNEDGTPRTRAEFLLELRRGVRAIYGLDPDTPPASTGEPASVFDAGELEGMMEGTEPSTAVTEGVPNAAAADQSGDRDQSRDRLPSTLRSNVQGEGAAPSRMSGPARSREDPPPRARRSKARDEDEDLDDYLAPYGRKKDGTPNTQEEFLRDMHRAVRDIYGVDLDIEAIQRSTRGEYAYKPLDRVARSGVEHDRGGVSTGERRAQDGSGGAKARPWPPTNHGLAKGETVPPAEQSRDRDQSRDRLPSTLRSNVQGKGAVDDRTPAGCVRSGATVDIERGPLPDGRGSDRPPGFAPSRAGERGADGPPGPQLLPPIPWPDKNPYSTRYDLM